jgi:hypothetical protein
VSLEDLRRITLAAIDAAGKSFQGKEYAVVVVVREIGGTQLNVGSNVVGGKENMVRVLNEAASKLKGD